MTMIQLDEKGKTPRKHIYNYNHLTYNLLPHEFVVFRGPVKLIR